MNEIDVKVTKLVLGAKLKFLVEYYEERLPEIEEEYKQAREKVSIGEAMGGMAGSYKACSKAMLLELKEIKEKIEKLGENDKTK